jgi:hypothetical protein
MSVFDVPSVTPVSRFSPSRWNIPLLATPTPSCSAVPTGYACPDGFVPRGPLTP